MSAEYLRGLHPGSKPSHTLLIKNETTFSCSLIKKRSPQRVAPHVGFVFFKTPDALSDTPQRVLSPRGDQT